MSKMIQIRDVPDAMHRRLKARAAEAGMSLSDYLRIELTKSVERPTPEELWRRIRSRTTVVPSTPPAAAVRRERGDP